MIENLLYKLCYKNISRVESVLKLKQSLENLSSCDILSVMVWD
jgi:hypothetical protein